MAKSIDLGSVMGPNKITTSTKSDITGFLYAENGYVRGVEKTIDTQYIENIEYLMNRVNELEARISELENK